MSVLGDSRKEVENTSDLMCVAKYSVRYHVAILYQDHSACRLHCTSPVMKSVKLEASSWCSSTTILRGCHPQHATVRGHSGRIKEKTQHMKPLGVLSHVCVICFVPRCP